MEDGSEISDSCLDFQGSTENPMSKEQRKEKFCYCATRIMSEHKAEELWEDLNNLENVDNISKIIALSNSNWYYSLTLWCSLSRGGGMVDAVDLKSIVLKDVRVRVSPSAYFMFYVIINIWRY